MCAPSRSVTKEPYSRNAPPVGAPVPFFVMMLITPPIASDPQSMLCAPRRISIRSMLSVVKFPKSNSPAVGLLTMTPSTKTSVCEVLAPRIPTVAVVPGPPFCVTVMLCAKRSASITVLIFFCSNSSPLITSTALVSWLTGTGVFVAVTTTSSRT